MDTLMTFLCFEFKEFVLSLILIHSNIFDIKLGTVEVLFISVPPKWLSFGYSALFFHDFQFDYVCRDF